MPLHIQFEIRAVEDRARSIAEGGYRTRDADFIIYHMPGDKNTVVEKEITPQEVATWTAIAHDKRPLNPHKMHIPALYAAWKENKEAPVNGKRIEEWPIMSPSQVHQAKAVGIRTVEDFAELNEEGLRAFGMGSQTLKQKAQEYLKAASGPGKIVEEMTAIKAENKQKDEQLAALQAQVNTLMAAQSSKKKGKEAEAS